MQPRKMRSDHYPGGGSFSDATNQYQEAGSYNVTSADFAPKIVYKGVYSVMYHCNLILEKIPETNDARINRVKAEANFLRAHTTSPTTRPRTPSSGSSRR